MGRISRGELCIWEKIRQSWYNAMLCVYSEHTHWYVTICKTNPPSIILKILINKSKLHLHFIFLLRLEGCSFRLILHANKDWTGEGEIINNCIHSAVLRDRVAWLFYCLGCPILLNYLPWSPLWHQVFNSRNVKIENVYKQKMSRLCLRCLG